MVRRWQTRLVRERLRSHPAVAVVGPRQCGKTTLARALPCRYFDLEVEVETFRTDSDLSALRQRGDFRALLAELEAGKSGEHQ